MTSNGRTLVTGGAGFIGSHVVDLLVRRGQPVTVLDDLSSGERHNLDDAVANGDVRFIEGSILDADACRAALEGCASVIHMAVQCVRRSIGRPIENHDVNATGTLQVLEHARRAGVGRFLYCSSSEVYGNGSSELLNEHATVCEPVTVYGAAKLAGEYYTKAYFQTYGLATAVVRPFNAYGPREHDRGDLAEVIPRFTIRVLQGQAPLIFGSGENGRDFTYVTEVAAGIVQASTSEALVGRTVNLARGTMITINEVAAAVARSCGRPDIAARRTAPRPGDVIALHADTTLARTLLGFRAEIDFATGLDRYVAWFRKRYPDLSALPEQADQNWEMPAI